MVLAFGPFELDVAACELRRNGRSVPLQPRVFDTLRYLVEHRDRLVAKQELIDALWGGQQLNAVAVPWSISHARKALGHGHEQRYIETVRGRGYRFVAEVHELTARSSSIPPEPASTPALAPSTVEPFVGREAVMLQLTAALELGRAGRGCLFLLAGEPGIGKTRCTRELAAIARNRGTSVWSGHCLDSGAAPAFWPFIQVLRDAGSDPTLAELDRLEAERLLDQLVPQEDSTPALDPGPASDDARFWLLDRLSRFLVSSARTRLRVIAIDDLHWADDNSLRALALLAPQLERSQLIVLGTARETTPDPERGATHLSLRLRPCERISLGGLLAADVAQYLRAMLGRAPHEELIHAVHSRTAGNPLFVREAVRILCPQHARGGEVRAADVRLPEAARGFLSDRFAALDPETRAVLDAACVIGDEFELPVLQRVTGLPGERLLASLQTAETLRIVERKQAGVRHGFAHPLLREVLYESLATGPRAQLHAKVGLAFEALALIEPRLNQLAHHFHLASTGEHHERAARYGRLAGDAAMRVFAYEEAAQFYGWALDAQPYLNPRDTRSVCDLLLASAGALVRAGRRREWRAQCKQAITLARQAGLAEVLIAAARQLRPSVMGALVPDPLAVTALQDALELLPDSAVGPRALALSRLASIPPYALEIERSRELSEQAMQLARTSGDRTLLLEALRSRLRSLSGPDTIPELLRVTDEILAADPHVASWWSSDAVVIRYQTCLRLGDLAGAERALARFARMAEEMRVREWRWHHDRMLAMRALSAGRLDEAERTFNELWLESQQLRLPYGAMLYAAQLNALSLERTGRRLSTGAPDGGDPWKWAHSIPSYRIQQIVLAIQFGELETARHAFRGLAERRFAAVTRDSNFLFGMAKLASAAIALDERESAQVLYELLGPYADLFAISDFMFSLGSVAHPLGMLAHYLGAQREARPHLLRAIEQNLRTGHELRALRARLSLAQLLAESRSRPDRGQALALASEVRAGAQRLGLNELRAAAVVVIERLSAARAARLQRGSFPRVRELGKAVPRKRARLS